MPEPVDCELLAQLLDEHGAALELYAGQWSSAPEDCVQEAFIELARQPLRPENAAAWLFRVVRNRAISAARSHDRRRRRESQAAQMRPASSAEDEPFLDSAALAESLDAIGDAQREAIVARIWGQLSFEQIGQLMGISTSGAHRHYLAAIQALRKTLGAPCENRKTDASRSLPNQDPRRRR